MTLDLSRRPDGSAPSRQDKAREVGLSTRGLLGIRITAVPRPLLLLSAALVVVGATIVFLGAWHTGVSWDETYHVLRMRNFLDTGWYLLDAELLGDEPGPWEDKQ